MTAEALSLKEWLRGLDCPGMYDALVDQVRLSPRLRFAEHATLLGSG